MTKEEFVKKFGGVYEHSSWIAEAAFMEGAAPEIDGIHARMKAAVEGGGRARQLALICAHPDLACAQGELSRLTQSSKSEQSGAGLNQCTPEEFAEFQKLNRDYRAKFGFPFIIAVKGLSRQDILSAFRKRMENLPDDEFATALAQIHRIARFRLEALLQAS